MLFFIKYKNKEYRVRVESRSQKFHVSFEEEEEREADIAFQGNDCVYLKDNEVFSANVVGRKEEFTVWRPQGNLPLSVESEYKRLVNLLRGQDLSSENNVYAKMPGKIVKLLTRIGDKVEKGAPVLIMEAMKMENEIRAPREGLIRNICVSEGQAVETGSLLVELDL